MNAIAASRAALKHDRDKKKGSPKKATKSKVKDADIGKRKAVDNTRVEGNDTSFLSDSTLVPDRQAVEREDDLPQEVIEEHPDVFDDSALEDVQATEMLDLTERTGVDEEQIPNSTDELQLPLEGEAREQDQPLDGTGELEQSTCVSEIPHEATQTYEVAEDTSAENLTRLRPSVSSVSLPPMGKQTSIISEERRNSLASMASRRSAGSMRSRASRRSQPVEEIENGFKKPPSWVSDGVRVEGPDGRRGQLVAKRDTVMISKFDLWRIDWDDFTTSDRVMTWEGIMELYSGTLVDHVNKEDWRRGELMTRAPMAFKPKTLELKQEMYAALTLPRDRASALRAAISANRLSLARRREEFADAVRTLDLKLDTELAPGQAFKEVAKVQNTMLRSHMPRDDPLVLKSFEAVGRWEKSNSGLRVEAKLASATKKAAGGYKHREPHVGYHLGVAIMEAQSLGADMQSLIKAEEALDMWEDARETYARDELKLALYGGVQNEIEEAIELCQTAGIDDDELAAPLTKVKRMQWEQEINLEIEEAAQDIDNTKRLERVIARAHSLRFTEEDSLLLHIGVLQVKMRFLVPELSKAVKTRQYESLASDVEEAQRLLDFSGSLIKKISTWIERKDERAPPEIMLKVLEQEQRSLRLVLPAAVDLLHVMTAENDLKRVLGAVERYAEQLPAVIEQGKKQVPFGLKRELVTAASEHLSHYTRAVTDLKEAIEAFEHFQTLAEVVTPADAPPLTPSACEELHAVVAPDAEELKAALVKARMAGAPNELIKRADTLLHTHAFDVWQYVQKELELRIALAEADDIEEMDVDSRFMRLQDAEYGAQSLDPPLEESLMSQVGDINLALAAERGLVTQVSQAEVIMKGDDIPPTPSSTSTSGVGRRRSFVAGMAEQEDDGGTQTEECIEGLHAACIAARTSALEEAKKLIPHAESLAKRLQTEVEPRRVALAAVKDETNKWQGKVSALRKLLIAAREVGVAFNLLAKGYRELDKRKVAFLLADLDLAVGSREWALATALALRGKTLRHRAKNDDGIRLNQSVESLVGKADGVLQISGVIRGERRGGVFGNPCWRDNPHFVIRQASRLNRYDSNLNRSDSNLTRSDSRLSRSDSRYAGRSPSKERQRQTIRVTVAVAEASPALSLALHVVENNATAAEAGCGDLLVPGYKLLASSSPDDDLPVCEFDLPSTADEEHPIHIVPSAASGEHGAFTLVVRGSDPVEVEEVSNPQRAIWYYKWSTEVRWSSQRPHSRYRGGKRVKESAPPLSWYRNPQFRVRATGPVGPPLPPRESLSKLAESFPFASYYSDNDVTSADQTMSLDVRDSRSDLMAMVADNERTSLGSLLSVPQANADLMAMVAERERTSLGSLLNVPQPIAENQSDYVHIGVRKSSMRSTSSVGSGQGSRTDCKAAKKPLLQAYLVPLDSRQCVPVAIHIVQNLTDKEDRTEENPMRHQVIASSAVEGSQYQVSAEVGTACVLPRRPGVGEYVSSAFASESPVEASVADASLQPLKRTSRRKRTLRKSQVTEVPENLPKTDSIFVVPSLKSAQLEGAFTLHLVSTAPVDIEQVNC